MYQCNKPETIFTWMMGAIGESYPESTLTPDRLNVLMKNRIVWDYSPFWGHEPADGVRA